MKYAIGIDLGGTYIKYAVVGSDGVVVIENKCPTPPSRDLIMAQLKRVVAECILSAAEKGYELIGVGVGTPEIVDPTERILLGGSPNIEGWRSVAIADEIKRECGLDVRLCNDANAMAMAEHTFGAARGLSDVVFIIVGTGIGGAAIVDNRLLKGYRNRGGEFGCTPFNVDGDIRCNCGAIGCWESYASTAACLRFYEKRTGERISGEELVARYADGEEAAREILEQEAYWLGRGIAGLINIFAPQMVVIGGGISQSGDFFIRSVSDAALNNTIEECSINTVICSARMGNQAGVIGAASMMF